jgi:hypothetical protein
MDSGTRYPKVARTLAVSITARSESPPSLEKSSCRPTCPVRGPPATPPPAAVPLVGGWVADLAAAGAFTDDVLATAILDRYLRHCEVITINGPSWRLNDKLADPAPAPTVSAVQH